MKNFICLVFSVLVVMGFTVGCSKTSATGPSPVIVATATTAVTTVVVATFTATATETGTAVPAGTTTPADTATATSVAATVATVIPTATTLPTVEVVVRASVASDSGTISLPAQIHIVCGTRDEWDYIYSFPFVLSFNAVFGQELVATLVATSTNSTPADVMLDLYANDPILPVSSVSGDTPIIDIFLNY
jgi:hypothetical protein